MSPADKDVTKKDRKQDRKVLDPSPTQKLEDDQDGLIVRSIALHCASNVLSNDAMVTSKQLVAMATHLEQYLLSGNYEEQDD